MVCKTLVCTAALALALPWCAHAALPQTGLTYFNDFTGNWTAQHGEDAFPLGGDTAPTYCTVPGKEGAQALDFEHWDSGRMGDETSALLAGTATNWLNLYGITDGSESVGNQQSLLPRSTWLKVTGGRYNRIVGGRTNGHAGNISEGSGNGANTVTGDFNVQLSGQGTTARNIIGGFYGTGNGLNNDVADRGAPCSLNGDTTVVVTDGATVTGGIIGGSAVRFVAANETFTHDGSSSVTVRSVLAAPKRTPRMKSPQPMSSRWASWVVT